MANNDVKSTGYVATTGAKEAAAADENGGPRCFFWVFAIPPADLTSMEVKVRNAVAGTPPPHTGGLEGEPLELRPMKCTDVNMDHLVFVESPLFAGATAQEAHDAAEAFVETGEGKDLHDRAVNAVLYQFAVGSAIVF